MRTLAAVLTLLLLPLISMAELIDVNQTELYVEKIGRGTPIVVLHGGPGLDHGYLRPQLDPLAIRNQVIFYDQRCCGYSHGDPTSEPLTVDQYVEDIEGLRQKMELDRIILLGHSWGGHLAMRYAIKYPDKVAALILMSSCPACSHGIQSMANNYKTRLATQQAILQQIKDSKPFRESNPSTLEAYYMMVFSTQTHKPGDAKKINLNFTAESAKNYGKVNQALSKDLLQKPFDMHEELQKITAPTLIVHGEVDFIPIETAKKIQKAIPNARLVEIEDAGHFPFVEKNSETIQEITAFLSNLELVGNPTRQSSRSKL